MRGAGIRAEDLPGSESYNGPKRKERAMPRDAATGRFLHYPQGSGMEHMNPEVDRRNGEMGFGQYGARPGRI